MAAPVPFLPGQYRDTAAGAAAILAAGAFGLVGTMDGKGSTAGLLGMAFLMHSVLLAAPAGIIVLLAGEKLSSVGASRAAAALIVIPYLAGAFLWLRSHVPAGGEQQPETALTWLTPVFANIFVSAPLFLISLVWIAARRRQELRSADGRRDG